MVLLIPLSSVIMILHHPRVAQTRKRKKQKKRKCIVVEARGTRRLIKRRGWCGMCGAMRYRRKIGSRSLTRRERKQKAKDKEGGAQTKRGNKKKHGPEPAPLLSCLSHSIPLAPSVAPLYHEWGPQQDLIDYSCPNPSVSLSEHPSQQSKPTKRDPKKQKRTR